MTSWRGQGMEALLEPEMECAVGGDCRQPGGLAPRLAMPQNKNKLGH
ncbi:MAG: hypothetical protein ACKVOQ_16450 [Cyclobacteriaceae bacterium]